MTKLCRQQAEVSLNHGNKIFAILDTAKPDTENIRGLNLAAIRRTTVQVKTTVVAEATRKRAIICCTEPGLTEALYVLHIHLLPCIACKIVNIFYIMTNYLLLQTMTLTKDRSVLSSERAPNKDKTVTVKQ
jgi:hypothetical protein